MNRRVVMAVVAFGALLVAVGCVPDPPPGPDQCPVGFYSATGDAPCTPASEGTFVDVVGATEATPCPPGTFQDEVGQASCKDAPVGTFVNTEGATEAIACDLGRYQDEEGQTLCKVAPAGSYVDVMGAVAATPCALGEYQPNSGATGCWLAPVGKYVDTTGATAATPCPDNTTTQSTGSTSADDCEAQMLAVAYSNLDGIDGYDSSGTDVLIAKLVDTNLDGVASVGDTVIMDRYPLDLDASAFGSFQVTSHVVASGVFTSSTAISVHDAADNSYDFFARPEIYQSCTAGIGCSFLYESTEDILQIFAVMPGSPDTPVTYSSVIRNTDDPFIDVDLFI